MKKNLLFIALALLTFMSSCVKDREDFIPDEGINYKSNILGIVTDESNQPVEGATVVYDGVTKTTDKNGIYAYSNVNVGSKHSFIKIRKNGYFEASRAFNTQKPANIQLKNIMVKKDFNKNFQASSGGTVAANGYEIKFPSNAIVIESTGAAYTGQVNVAVKHLDPKLDATSYKMPGNLTGISAANNIEKLNTFGMLAVELQSASGEKLQIKSGQQVEIAVDAIANGPATVPLWYFDETLGYWKEEGTATLVNGKYVGKVGHFSWWNYDASRPSINVNGRVVDQDGNPLVCDVWFTVPGEYGGHGQTNTDGTFSGAIGKDVELNLSIFSALSGCQNNLIYSVQVGPFSADITLPDITVNITGPETFSCEGTFKDCDGNLVQDGYIKVIEGGSYIHYFPIVNGQGSGSFLTCANPISAIVSAIDLIEYTESTPTIETGPGNHNLGEVQTCAATVDHLSVICTDPGLLLNENLLEFQVIDSFGLKSIYAYGKPSTQIEYFNLSWGDGATSFDVYNTGAFPINYAQLYTLNPGEGYTYVNGSGTITITDGGTTGDVLKGTYTMVMQNTQNPSVQRTFTGSIQRKL